LKGQSDGFDSKIIFVGSERT